MNQLTVLSPHQDDAGLSLAMTIRASARSGRVRIVNCFTVSEYAPHLEARNAAAIGTERRKEDREFASRAGEGIEVIDLKMEDAPIRLGLPVGEVRRLRVGAREREDASRIAADLADLAEGLVLAPLGLGGHIDHLVARQAAMQLARRGRAVGFYEDLPYASELRECCILRTADAAARGIGARLSCALMRDREAAARKRFAIDAYRSQLSAEEMDGIVRYNERRGGERLWIAPKTEGLVPAPLEQAGIQAGNPAAALGRRFECAAHYFVGRARAACRRAQLNLRGGRINAPQTN
jgi:LmbE family N-acetylglucosaminyl deacetylase